MQKALVKEESLQKIWNKTQQNKNQKAHHFKIFRYVKKWLETIENQTCQAPSFHAQMECADITALIFKALMSSGYWFGE